MAQDKALAQAAAKELLKIKAVFLSPQKPFTWASGILSPIYCDNRLTLSYPAVRKLIENGLAVLIKENYPDCQAVFGTATAGIAHAALVAEILALPMGYVRADAKSHGRNNKIEGVPPAGLKVVVVEDLISTGGSSVEVVGALREIGADVLGIVSIFTYGLKAGEEKLKEASVKNVSLTDFSTLTEVALSEKYITESELKMLAAFQQNPSDPAWREIK
jgi:orotate phosphoribosyltransferase